MDSPRIKTIPEKKLIGKHLKMSLSDNKTFELWHSFMPHRKNINAVSADLFSLQVYADAPGASNFNEDTVFEKWAAVEVADFTNIPEGMETLTLPRGLYAVFDHKGPASDGHKTFRFIFSEWLPQSEYEVDDRPHFELLGPKYKNNEPDSEEEVWIPVKRRR